jgi:hypothetical protein
MEDTMSETLEALERKREALYRKLHNVGDLRRGLVSDNFRKCGKPNCACAQEGHSGHGPQHLWNATIKGKSHAKNLKEGPELRKYLNETANHRVFRALCEELVEVNERICDARPLLEAEGDDESAALKKKSRRRSTVKSRKK